MWVLMSHEKMAEPEVNANYVDSRSGIGLYRSFIYENNSPSKESGMINTSTSLILHASKLHQNHHMDASQSASANNQ
jgi:hypothetical protein